MCVQARRPKFEERDKETSDRGRQVRQKQPTPKSKAFYDSVLCLGRSSMWDLSGTFEGRWMDNRKACESNTTTDINLKFFDCEFNRESWCHLSTAAGDDQTAEGDSIYQARHVRANVVPDADVQETRRNFSLKISSTMTQYLLRIHL